MFLTKKQPNSKLELHVYCLNILEYKVKGFLFPHVRQTSFQLTSRKY